VIHESPWAERLVTGKAALNGPEKVALLNSTRAALLSLGGGEPDRALQVAGLFIRSPEVPVVATAIGLAGGVAPFVPDDLIGKYQAFVRSLAGGLANELGWEPKPGEAPSAREIRAAILPFVAVQGNDASISTAARDVAERWLRDSSSVEPELALQALSVAARTGDRAFFDTLVTKLAQTTNARDRMGLVNAIYAFTNPELVQAGLQLGLTGAPGIDPRELSRTWTTPRTREIRVLTWEFVKQKFDELNSKLPGARGIPFGATLPQVAVGFCDEGRAAEVEAFFKPRIANLSGAQRNVDRAIESIRLCASRRARLEPGLRSFVSKY
jgi:hypothetical protein